MDSFGQYADEFRAMFKRPRGALMQFLNLFCFLATLLMLWRVFMFGTGSESPVVVVLSGSMEPAFHRGDILFLNMWNRKDLGSGDVIVFAIEGRGIPIVHRILNSHIEKNSPERQALADAGNVPAQLPNLHLLTKGDNNAVDDRGLYNHKQNFIGRREVMGRAFLFLPYIGLVIIVLNDYPWMKYLLIAAMMFFILIGRDQSGWW